NPWPPSAQRRTVRDFRGDVGIGDGHGSAYAWELERQATAIFFFVFIIIEVLLLIGLLFIVIKDFGVIIDGELMGISGGAAFDIVIAALGRALRRLGQHGDLAFSLIQQGVAGFERAHGFFVGLNRVLKREVAGFELGNA